MRFAVNKGREVARIKPDGTWWIDPNITLEEMCTAFHPLLETAAKLLKKVSDVRKAVQV
jgi:hypothetical protein